MITPDYVRLMAVYNHWQNDSLVRAADMLGEDARRKDRGAFFGSIHATLNHILWADQIWMHRLAGTAIPQVGTIPESTGQHPEWDAFKAARAAFDGTMMDWSRRVTETDLTGDLSWYSGALEADVVKPRWILITHMFNHATHHRGQVHAMLTADGARPDATDIPFMPDQYRSMI